MTAAVFSDVDGTLVAGSLPRIVVLTGREMGVYSAGLRLYLDALLATGKLLGERRGKAVEFMAVMRACAGRTEDQIRDLIRRLTPRLIAAAKPGQLARLRDHQAAGLPLILCSGAMHEAVVDLAGALGGHGEGTHMVRRDGLYTDKIQGKLCQGQGKADRARRLISELGLNANDCHAYGDTASDIPFLSLFGHPAAVDPDPKLAAEAARRGWPILAG